MPVQMMARVDGLKCSPAPTGYATHSNTQTPQHRKLTSTLFQRRAGVAILGMLAQQLSGQIFTSQYGVLFYQQQGYGNSFALGIVYTSLQFATALFTSFIVDRVGRRPLLLGGGVAQATFLYLVGGLGTIAHPNSAAKDTLVAGLMLFGVFFGLTWAPLSYITMAEAPARRVAEKTSMLANSISITGDEGEELGGVGCVVRERNADEGVQEGSCARRWGGRWRERGA